MKRSKYSQRLFTARAWFLTLISFALAAPSLLAQQGGTPAAPANGTDSPSFVVRGARVFDGRSTLGNQDVWVEDGKIKAVGASLKTPDALREVNGQGATLLPGLIDAHTHAWADALKQALVFGVTTELDMSSDPKYDAEMRRMEVDGKNHDAAELRSAGTPVTVAKGHGDESGTEIPVLTRAAEAQSFVDARIAEGSDYIEVIYDDGSAYGHPVATLSKEELAAVIKAAHNRHKLAVVHIGSQAGAIDAINAGADGLEHIFEDAPPSGQFVKLAKKHHIFVVATLTVSQIAAGGPRGEPLSSDPHLGPYIDSQSAANLKRAISSASDSKLNFANALAAVAALQKTGVPILAGSDAPNPGTAHGVGLHRELELLVQAGLTPQEALASATSLPAQTFGLNDRGRIAPGLRADLLLVKGDPTRDITATRDILDVWKTGYQENREPFRRAAEKEKQQEAASHNAAPPPGSESGLISDFEDQSLQTKFGMGFSVSTDAITGGRSTAELKIIEGGPSGSKHALQITGVISPAFQYPWAGAMFSPSRTPTGPANLSGKKALHFSTHGDGRTYRVLLFTQSGGYLPAQKTFATGPDWTEVEIPFSDFNTDGHDITGILFTATSDPGAFIFAIDNLKVE